MCVVRHLMSTALAAATGVAMEVPAFISIAQLFPSAFSEAAATDCSE